MTPLLVNSALVSVPQRLLMQQTSWRKVHLQVRYGFFDHPKVGPVLIDTGYGPRVTIGQNRSGWLRAYAALIQPQLSPQGDALTFLRQRGIAPADISHVILTHFHADHVAAMRDFPQARFWVDHTEWQLVRSRSHFANIRHGVFPELLPGDIEDRLCFIQEQMGAALPFDLGRGFDIFGDGSMLSVALPGHSSGHFGVLFPRLDRPLLYAVDTHWLASAIKGDTPPTIAARLACDDIACFRASMARVRNFHAAGGAFALCHDPAPSPYDHHPEVAP